MLKPIEFSELTNKLRRNIMGSALLIIVIGYYKIGVTEPTFAGMKLTGLTAEIILLMLFLFMIYHLFAFAIRAHEEFRLWEMHLTLEESHDMMLPDIVGLATRLARASDTIDNIIANSGLLNAQGQTVFTNEDAHKLKAITATAETYARHFKNFPATTKLRFWGWDVGIVVLVSLVALYIYFSS